jgi:hypothetical protein
VGSKSLECALKVIGHFRASVAAAAAAALLSIVLQGQAVADEWRWSGVDRIVAVSDVHGALGAMTATLTKAGVLNDELRWSGGETHLVITGDILDRGPDSRKVMDLLMRIEEESLDAGGRVHLLLGNHEVMNLVGDLRYVSKAEYAAFAADELAEDRERWFSLYRGTEPETADEAVLRKEYAGKYPAGFFGLRRAFGTQGAYGPWLMSKPLLIVINGTAFVHGGMSPLVAELGLDGINQELKSQVTEYVSQSEVLAEEGLLDPTENFYAHEEVLTALPETIDRPEHIAGAIESVIRLNNGGIHGARSPLWYRGSVGCGPLIEEDKLAAALAAIGADRVVIGHTPTLTRRVLQRMGGRVVQIDTGMLTSAYQGSGNALVIEGDSMTVVGEKASADYQPVAHPRRVGFRSDELTVERLQQILSDGAITPTSTPESGTMIVNVTLFGEDISAVFEENGRSKNVYPELAAYRLDRLLGLDMVPVTVARELDGKQGSLQFVPGSMMNDEERGARNRGGAAWCPLPEQWQAMYVFDSLIYNQGRQQHNMLYSIDNWQLILAGHDHAFATNRGLPTYIASMQAQTGEELQLGSGWQKALAALTDDYLAEQLGDVLDKRRIRALTRRRDDLLKR